VGHGPGSPSPRRRSRRRRRLLLRLLRLRDADIDAADAELPDRDLPDRLPDRRPDASAHAYARGASADWRRYHIHPRGRGGREARPQSANLRVRGPPRSGINGLRDRGSAPPPGIPVVLLSAGC